MSDAISLRFTDLRRELPELVRDFDRISARVNKSREILSSDLTSVAVNSARLVYLSTDLTSTAWETRYRIIECIMISRYGRTSQQIREDIAFYVVVNDNTLRGHLNLLKKSGAIGKDNQHRWFIDLATLASIQDAL